MTESALFVTGVDENGNPANAGARLDEFNRLTLLTSPGVREVHLDPDAAAEYLKLVREVDRSGGPPK